MAPRNFLRQRDAIKEVEHVQRITEQKNQIQHKYVLKPYEEFHRGMTSHPVQQKYKLLFGV